MAMTLFGRRMDQEWIDLLLWEEFFKNFPIKTFIEIGTGMGGMATYFALQCHEYGIKFHTFDNQRWIDFDHGLPALLGMKTAFHHIDIWDDKGKEVAETIVGSAHPLAIFFDNGNKPKEWRWFSIFAHVGDYLVVHDWGTEFLPKDVGDTPVERIMVELSDSRPRGYQAMWFRRV